MSDIPKPQIAIIAAMPSELHCLPSALRHLGRCAGIGLENARRCAEQALAEGADLLISYGVAGALDERLQVGELVLPSALVGPDGRAFSCCPPILADLPKRDYRLVSSPVAVTSARQRSDLARRYAAALVDMESAAIAEAATEQGRSFFSIRAISDGSSDELPETLFARLHTDGRVRIAALVGQVLVRPALLIMLVRLAWRYRKALKSLKIAGVQLQRWLADMAQCDSGLGEQERCKP